MTLTKKRIYMNNPEYSRSHILSLLYEKGYEIKIKYNPRIDYLNILEKYGATRLLEKNNISLNTKAYQNLKLNQLCNSKYQTEWTQQSLHNFQNLSGWLVRFRMSLYR